MKKIPLVKEVMTPFPYCIEADASLAAASDMMETHNIRHLPVKDKEELVSIISERDINLAQQPGHRLSDFSELTVADLCALEVYRVDTHTRLDKVLDDMANNHIGAALVFKEGRLAGIFTSSDACKAFAALLREPFLPPGEGHDAA